MDYLEYQNYLAHARGSFGANVRKRLAGVKRAGSQMFARATGASGSSGGGSVGGKSGRKWKNHKYIAIVNGRYIYPAKQAARETFTTKGREAKRVRLSRDVGRNDSQRLAAAKQANKAQRDAQIAKNAYDTAKDARSKGTAASKRAVADAKAKREGINTLSSLIAKTNSERKLANAKRRTPGEFTRDAMNAIAGTNSSNASAGAKAKVRLKSKNNIKKPDTKTIKNDISSHKKAATTHEPKTQETKSNQEQLPDRRNLIDRLKENNPRFGKLGPDPEKIREILDENRKKRKKK